MKRVVLLLVSAVLCAFARNVPEGNSTNSTNVSWVPFYNRITWRTRRGSVSVWISNLIETAYFITSTDSTSSANFPLFNQTNHVQEVHTSETDHWYHYKVLWNNSSVSSTTK